MTTERQELEGHPDEPLSEDLVFHFRDPNLKFEPGTRITGMKTWTDLGFVFLKLAYDIAKTAESDTQIPLNLIAFPSIEEHFIRRDRAYGFFGQSGNFEVEIKPTDLSIADKRRKIKPDPKLTRTFELSRQLRSAALPQEGATVSAVCALSLSDRGIATYRNAYDDGNDYAHNFGASFYSKPINESVLLQIKRSMTRPGSVAAERSTPIQMGRRRL